jgi:hypothetical protein
MVIFYYKLVVYGWFQEASHSSDSSGILFSLFNLSLLFMIKFLKKESAEYEINRPAL